MTHPLYIHFGQPSSWISITGEDAAEYLQSQFSNDLSKLTEGAIVYGFWLSRKGKVEADSYIFKQADRFILYSLHCPGASLVTKLEANIIADEVEITTHAPQLHSLTLIGEDSPLFLKQLNLSLPKPQRIITQGDIIAFSIPRSKKTSCELIFPEEGLPKIQSVLQNIPHETLSAAALEDERITSNIPKIPQDIGPNDFPQEADLDILGVSYSKGCYLGQEVMQRLHNIGGVQRKLFSVKCSARAQTLPAPLYKGEKQVGELRSQSSDGQAGLALLKHKLITPKETLSIEPNAQPSVTILTMCQ